MEPEDLLHGILNAGECAAAQLMLSLEIDLDDVRRSLDSQELPILPEETSQGQADSEGEAALQNYGTDMTEKAADGAYDPMIGREDILERLIQILSRRTKNNPVLIGEPGVGGKLPSWKVLPSGLQKEPSRQA